MPITQADFATLTDDLQGIFNEVAKTKVADMTGLQLFEVTDTNRRTFDHLILHGLSVIESVTPGQDLPKASTNEGDSVTWTQSYYGGQVDVTKEMRKFDLYDQITSLVRSMVTDAFDKIDQSLADVLLYGFSGSSYTDVYGDTHTSTTPGGETIINSAHTNNVTSTTFDNRVTDGTTANVALSRKAIVATRAVAKRFTDPEGIARPVNLDTLIVGPGNEDLAERIIFSTNLPGSSNNDNNPLKGKINRFLVWDRLDTRSDATDTSAYWFLADSANVSESLKSKFAERPTLDAPEQVYANKNWEYTTDFFYTIGRGWPAYLYGSTGAN